MVMKYILIRKNVKENEYYFSGVFEAELREVFSNLSNKTFELELAGKTYILEYKFSNKQNNVYYLHIEFHASPAIEAEILNEVSKILSGSEIRKKHNFIVAYDEVSEKTEPGAVVNKDNGSERDFGRFGCIVNALKKQEWFMGNVLTWILYDSDDSDSAEDFSAEDLLAHYAGKSMAGV